MENIIAKTYHTNISPREYTLSIEKMKNTFPLSDNVSENLLFENIKKDYVNLSIYDNYGHKRLDYLLGLSCRYAINTSLFLKCDILDPSIISYTLWLSLFWIIDSIFDKFRKNLSVNDLKNITDIFEQLDNGITVDIPSCNCNSDNLLECLPKTIITIYGKYLSLVSNYNKDELKHLTYWTKRYFDSIFVNEISNLKEYQKWRLDSGAMMCVCWHLSMCKNINPDIIQRDTFIFKKASLIVSYHNDLLSYDRDLLDGTHNLVKTIKHMFNLSNFDAYRQSISVINDIYKEIFRVIDGYDEDIKNLVLSVVEGSHNWTIGEERYKVGFSMLGKALADDDSNFDEFLNNKKSTAGDPKKL